MAGGKQSPRQKMINMMYLVLTALLALNVSKEILKSFYLVETSMEKAQKNIDLKNSDIMKAFEKQMENQPEKTRPYYEKAQEAEKITQEFYDYVEALKKQLVDQTGGREEGETGELIGKDNIEAHAQVLIVQKKGAELKEKINTTREKLLSLLDSSDRRKVVSDLVAEDNKALAPMTWESELFEHAPLAAVTVLMTKYQNDAKNTEADILNLLALAIDKGGYVVSKLEAKIFPKSTYVMKGETFEADVFLTAYDEKQTNDVIIGGKTYVPEAGKVTYKVPATAQGNFKVNGKIMVKDKEGVKPYEFSTEYMVFEGGATISADKMNVVYIGLENPISVSVPGFPPENVTVTLTGGGNLKKVSGGTYNLTVSPGTKEVTVAASVKLRDGSNRKMGEMKYRVRQVPKPEPQFGTLGSGAFPSSAIRTQRSLIASLGDFAFEGVKFNITQFTLTYSPRKGGGDMKTARGTGSALTPEMNSIMGGIKPGDKIIFSEIKAVGPGGVGGKDLVPIVIDVR